MWVSIVAPMTILIFLAGILSRVIRALGMSYS